MAKDMMGKVAIWAFIIGALIALLVGLWQAYTIEQTPYDTVFMSDMGGWIAWILAILGAIVGLLAMLGKGTITKSEVPAFLLAGGPPGSCHNKRQPGWHRRCQLRYRTRLHFLLSTGEVPLWHLPPKQ